MEDRESPRDRAAGPGVGRLLGVDVSERTDGHWLDTGDGPKPIALVSGIAMESKAQAAYRAYLDHMQDCEDCPECTFQCATAAALWRSYREIRG